MGGRYEDLFCVPVVHLWAPEVLEPELPSLPLADAATQARCQSPSPRCSTARHTAPRVSALVDQWCGCGGGRVSWVGLERILGRVGILGRVVDEILGRIVARVLGRILCGILGRILGGIMGGTVMAIIVWS